MAIIQIIPRNIVNITNNINILSLREDWLVWLVKGWEEWSELEGLGSVGVVFRGFNQRCQITPNFQDKIEARQIIASAKIMALI